jgi:hypothetical protein
VIAAVDVPHPTQGRESRRTALVLRISCWGPVAWRSAGPPVGPLAGPHFRVSEKTNAPAVRLQGQKNHDFVPRRGDPRPALFAPPGVKSGVKGEGGATPSFSRGLDPKALLDGVAPPSTQMLAPGRQQRAEIGIRRHDGSIFGRCTFEDRYVVCLPQLSVRMWRASWSACVRSVASTG